MGNLNINSKTTYITKGGIYVALSLVILYASVLVPFNTMFILLLASSIIPLSILTIGVKPTIIVYIAVSSISYFIIPTKSICIMYLLFFGSYGFIKYFIEGKKNKNLQVLLKFLFFNASAIIYLFLLKTLFATEVSITYNNNIVLLITPIIVYEVAFFIYDYALTQIITYLSKKVIKNLK